MEPNTPNPDPLPNPAPESIPVSPFPSPEPPADPDPEPGSSPSPEPPAAPDPQPTQPASDNIAPAAAPITGQVVSGNFDPVSAASAGTVAPADPATAAAASTGPVIGGTDPLAPPASSGGRSLKPFMIALAAVLIVGLGSAAAYVGIILPNKPDNVLKQAFINSLQEQQSSSKGTFSAASSGVAYKGSFSTAEDAAAKAVQGQFNLTVSGISFSVEARLIDQNLYIKLGDLSTISGLLTAYSPTIGSAIQPLSGELSNKWIAVDSTLLDSSPSVKCALNSSWTLNSADIKLLEDQYNKNPFETIKSTTSDTVGGQAAEKFVLSIDNAKLNNFGNGLQKLSVFTALNKCMSGKSTPTSLPSTSHGQTPLTVWVDKSTKRIVQIGGSSTSKAGDTSSLTITLNYGKVAITAPANATPAMQVLTQIENSSKSNPALLNLLSGSTGSSQ